MNAGKRTAACSPSKAKKRTETRASSGVGVNGWQSYPAYSMTYSRKAHAGMAVVLNRLLCPRWSGKAGMTRDGNGRGSPRKPPMRLRVHGSLVHKYQAKLFYCTRMECCCFNMN
jgi:hypothetical protein